MSYSKANHSVQEWSTPERRSVTGQPPSSADSGFAETMTRETRHRDIRLVTPMYKTDSLTTPRDTKPLSSPRHDTTDGDYRVESERDFYRLHVIDPKVHTRSHVPGRPLTVDYQYRSRPVDFPSEHSHRSFTKLDPLKPLQIRETRPTRVEAQRSGLLIVPEDETKRRERTSALQELSQGLSKWSEEKDREYQVISDETDKFIRGGRDRQKELDEALRGYKGRRTYEDSYDWENWGDLMRKTRSQTNVYPGFSPHSVVSINAEKGAAGQWDSNSNASYYQKRLSTTQTQTPTPSENSPQQYYALVPMSTNSRNSKYSSMPDLNDEYDRYSTLVKIRDERRIGRAPGRSIIKTRTADEGEMRELNSTSQAVTRYAQPGYTGPPALLLGNGEIVPLKNGLGLKETTSQTEETKHVEEIETTIREFRKPKKKSRHRSRSARHYESTTLPTEHYTSSSGGHRRAASSHRRDGGRHEVRYEGGRHEGGRERHEVSRESRSGGRQHHYEDQRRFEPTQYDTYNSRASAQRQEAASGGYRQEGGGGGYRQEGGSYRQEGGGGGGGYYHHRSHHRSRNEGVAPIHSGSSGVREQRMRSYDSPTIRR